MWGGIIQRGGGGGDQMYDLRFACVCVVDVWKKKKYSLINRINDFANY